MHVGLLCGQVVSPFGEHWLAGSHGGGGISRAGCHPTRRECFPTAATVTGHWELGAAALFKAVWWGMHLASLLTHLFMIFKNNLNVWVTPAGSRGNLLFMLLLLLPLQYKWMFAVTPVFSC